MVSIMKVSRVCNFLFFIWCLVWVLNWVLMMLFMVSNIVRIMLMVWFWVVCRKVVSVVMNRIWNSEVLIIILVGMCRM